MLLCCRAQLPDRRWLCGHCRYFGLISVCCAALFGTIYFGALGGIAPPRVMHTLLLGLATAASNLLFIEPAATKVLFQRYDLENSGSTDADLRKKLTKQFGAASPPVGVHVFTARASA